MLIMCNDDSKFVVPTLVDYVNLHRHNASFVELQKTHRKVHEMRAMLLLNIILLQNFHFMHWALIRLHLNKQPVKYFIVIRDTYRNVHNVHATLSHNVIIFKNMSTFALGPCLRSHCTCIEHIICIRSFNNDVDCARYHRPILWVLVNA